MLRRLFEQWIKTNYWPTRFAVGNQCLRISWHDGRGEAEKFPELVLWQVPFFGWLAWLIFSHGEETNWKPKVWKDKEGEWWIMAVDVRGMPHPLFCLKGHKERMKILYQNKGKAINTGLPAGALAVLGKTNNVYSLGEQLRAECEGSISKLVPWNEYCNHGPKKKDWKDLQEGTGQMLGITQYLKKMRNKYPWVAVSDERISTLDSPH